MLLLLLACTGAPEPEGDAEVTPEGVTTEPAPEPGPPPAPAGPAVFQVKGKGVAVLDAAGLRRVEGSPDEVDALALAPDGALWLSAKGELRRAPTIGAAFEVVELSGGPGPLEDMAFAPDGALWAVGLQSAGVLRGGAWEAVELRPAADFFEHVAARADGVVFASDRFHVYERGAEGWTTHDLREVVEGLEFTDELVVSPAGELFTVYGGQKSGLLRYADGAWTDLPGAARFDGQHQSIGFTPDGARITQDYKGLVLGEGGDAKTLEPRALGFSAYELTAFAGDAAGRLWIGTDDGLVLLDAERKPTQWSPGTLAALDGELQRVLVLEGGPTPPATATAQASVTGRLLKEGTPLGERDIALCSDASMLHHLHPCESASLSLESQTDAEGRFLFEDVPFGKMDLVYKDGERWNIVLGAGCCTELRPGEAFDMGDVDLMGEEEGAP